MTTVFVTNTSDIILTDGWDGVSYTFEPGKTIEVPEFVATHIFGYKEKDVAPKLARLGWAATLNDLEQGKQKLSKFLISQEPPKAKNHSVPPMVERVPLPSKKAGGNVQHQQ